MGKPTPNGRALTRSVLALALAGAPLARTTPAHADGNADEAQLHFEIAAERYRTADFRGALEHFLLSNRLVPNRNVVFNIARTYEQLRRFADAHRYYIDALQGELTAQTRQELEAAIARIAPNVAVLRVETSPPGATIFLDRRDLGSRGTTPRPLAVAEGRYRVIAALDGYEPAEAEQVEAHLGHESVVRLTLERIVGTAHVEGEAGAAVRVDDDTAAPRCVAPCDVQLAPGPHTLYLTREGYQVLPRQLTVTARQTANVRGTLVPLTGSIVVSADEREALVEVDGHSVGFTPVVVPNVPVGHRRVRVSLRGYAALEQEVNVASGQQAELNDLHLAPVREVSAASRFNETIDDAPSSVSVISPQELAAFAYPHLAEALRGIRGMSVGYDGIYHSFNVRGVGQPDDYNSRFLVLSDGLVLNDNVLYQSYVGYDGRTDLHDVDRVEVVRGPGSVLYGTGALAGVVNMVTRPRELPTSVHVAVGTYDNAVARARAGFTWNSGHDAGVWASLAAARSEGRDQVVDLSDGMGGFNPTVAHQYDSFWSSTGSARAWWGPATLQVFLTTREQAIPHGGYGTAFNDIRSRAQDTRMAAELRIEPRLSSNVQLMTRAYVNRYNYDAQLSFSPAASDLPNHEVYENLWMGAEARVIWNAHRAARVQVGVEGQYTPVASMLGEEGNVPAGGGARSRYLDTHADFATLGAYAVADGTVNTWFRYSAAARFDYNSLFGSAVNPRVAAIFRPVRRGVLKIMGGRAFRAPSVYQLDYNDGGITTRSSRNNNLQPESAWSGEVEYTHHLDDDWSAVGAVHFGYYDNLFLAAGSGTPADPTNYVNSHQPVLAVGGDVEIRREWRQGWMLSATYGYLSSRFLADATTGASMMNAQVPNAPEHLASFRAVAPIVAGSMSLATRVTLEAPRRISLSTDATTAPGVVADLVVSGYVSRFGIRYNVGLYNLFDWRYQYPVSETFTIAGPSVPQLGRSFMLNVMTTFQ